MYGPAYTKENRPEVLKDLVARYNFGAMISQTDAGPVITHLPFIFDGEKLVGHIARANPHWSLWETNPEVTLIFSGPHSYISPAWYSSDPMNVPTWNYVAIHVKGKVRIEKNDSEILRHMTNLTTSFEKIYQTHWELPETGPHGLLRQIVMFTVEDLVFEGKLKLSQTQSPVNVYRVISELKTKNPELAKLMSVYRS